MAVGLASGAGCQRHEPAAASVNPAYAADIETVCNAVERSGADKLAANEQMVTVAMWLGPNLKTADARAFLVHIQPLVGNAKADALDAERARVGLAACPLATVWRASDAGSALPR